MSSVKGYQPLKVFIVHDASSFTAECNEALEIYRELAAANCATYIPDVAMTLNNLALLHKAINKHKQAEAEYNEALDMITPYYEANPRVYQEHYNKIKRSLQKLTER